MYVNNGTTQPAKYTTDKEFVLRLIQVYGNYFIVPIIINDFITGADQNLIELLQCSLQTGLY